MPFSQINNFPTLYQDYCSRFEAVAEFYAGDYRDPGERAEAVERAIAVERDRSTLADVLLEQNERWGMSERTRENIETLRRDGSAAVVTGQQVGLFTGPIYTILKTLSTLQLAEQMTQETGRPVVPVFWIGGEDHDFEEIAQVYLLRGNEPVAIRYEDAPEGNPGPVGRIQLSDEIVRLLDQVDEILPATDFKPSLMQLVRGAYEPGKTFSDAFAEMLRGLFPDSGLVLMNSDDVRLKRLAASLFRREIADGDGVARGMEGISARLREEYHEQVQVRPANLFLFEDGGRYPLDADGSGYRLHNHEHDRTYSRAELTALVDASPEKFSPNVVLRPIMQDVLLPTAVYVGGPGEISYFAQYKPAYEWAGVPMPLIYPRASITIVESKIGKVLDKYGLDVADFGDDLDRLFQRVVVDAMEVDLDALFGEAGRHLDEAVDTLKPGLERVDPTLVKAAEAARSALVAEFERLKGKALRAEKKSQEIVRSQLEKVHLNLHPAGMLQERALSILHFLNKYSPAFLDELRSVVSTDTTEHQVVEV